MYEIWLHLDLSIIYTPTDITGRRVEIDITLGKHSAFICLGRLRWKPWIVGTIGKHTFAWR